MKLCTFWGLFGLIILTYKPLWAYNSLDQGYVSDEAEVLNCGQSCFGAPEIQTIIDSGFEIEKRGLYVSQSEVPEIAIESPWAQSRTKWLRKFGKNLHRENRRYSASAFRIGVGIQDRDRSFYSAFWSEIRKPILYDLRNRILIPLRENNKKKKLKVWAIEQTLDIGASAIGLDSYGYTTDVFDTDEILDRKASVVTSFKPRLDPFKGRYGARFQSKVFPGTRDPFFVELSYFYCNNEFGVGDRVCSFLHQFSTAYGYRFRAYKRDISFQLSVYWEVKSLDPEAYIVNGEAYDFKPWGFQSRLSIAI